MVSIGRSLGLELGVGITFRAAGQRHQRPRATSAAARHGPGTRMADRGQLWYRRRVGLHYYVDCFNNIHTANPAGYRDSRDEDTYLAGKPGASD